MAHDPKFILTFLLFTALGSIAFAQSYVPFTLSNEGHILIKAKINGVEGNFIFDTGAGLTLITKSFSEKIGHVEKQDGGYTGFRATGEQLSMDMYKANTLSVGNFVERDPGLTIIDANLGNIDGLVSLMSFRNTPFTIDYTTKRIIFETPKSLASIKHRGKRVPLQLDISRDKALDIFTYVVINGKLTLQFSIDSGAGADSYQINGKYIAALNIDTANARKIVHTSEFNRQIKDTNYVATVQSMALQSQPEIQRRDFKAVFIKGLIYDGKVSLRWIGDRITFDLENTEMIVL